MKTAVTILAVIGVTCMAGTTYPDGFTWQAAADWTNGSNGNPDIDQLGNPVWSYERYTGVPSYANLTASVPWYKYPTKMLVWDPQWYTETSGRGVWAAGDNTLPNGNGFAMSVTTTQVSLRRWVNPCEEPTQVSVAIYDGGYLGFPSNSGKADLAVYLQRTTGEVHVLFANSYSAPSPGTSPPDTYYPGVDLGVLDLTPGDSIVMTAKLTSGSFVTLIGGMVIKKVAVDTDGDGVIDDADAFPEDPTEWSDSDSDGIGDNADLYPESDTGITIVIGGIDTGVANHLDIYGEGGSINDYLAEIEADEYANSGQYMRTLVHFIEELVVTGYITGQEKGTIISTAAKTKGKRF